MRDAGDAEIARAIAEGSGDAPAAEAELCRRFGPRIRLYGLRHLRSEERAAELVQTALLAVIEAVRARRLEDPERLDRFVLGTCRNLAMKQSADARRVVPTEPAALDVASFVPSFDHLDAAALFGCLGRLDGRARTILRLTFEVELHADAIAETVATTAGNVRVLRHRALAQLKDCLERTPS